MYGGVHPPWSRWDGELEWCSQFSDKATGWKIVCSIPGRGRGFFSFLKVRIVSRANPAFILFGEYQESFFDIQRTVHHDVFL
jgi:hypothetical protein